MADSPQTIADAAKCFTCFDRKQFAAALLYLLNAIRVAGGGSAMTPQDIAAASVCFTCMSGKQTDAAMVYLMSSFVSGGGGGNASFYEFAGDPTGSPPTDPTKMTIVLDNTTGRLYTWSAVDQAWL